jgi:hypothetical protein
MNFPSKFFAYTQPDRATASHKYLTVKRLGNYIQKHIGKQRELSLQKKHILFDIRKVWDMVKLISISNHGKVCFQTIKKMNCWV